MTMGILLIGILLFLVLAKHAGLSIDKQGLRFKSKEKLSSVLKMITAVKESDVIQEKKIDNLVGLIAELSSAVNKSTRDVLRLTFYNDNLSPVERLVAGSRYLAIGGNGPTEQAINELAEKYPDVWESIKRMERSENNS
jgi:xanthine dehydrogenase iron-sulfur cluster and FAD-binding subunit A